MNRTEARQKLDNVIKKSRVHFYKPIQIAEILHHKRVAETTLDLSDLESYRTRSKQWRDAVCIRLLGNVCTSSAKFQDDLFSQTAVPPEALAVLGAENDRTGGAVEAYIYKKFTEKHSQLENALNYCKNAKPLDFDVTEFLNLFWNEPGLKRSLDKIYEIIVYSLFETIIRTLELTVNVTIAEDKLAILKEFEDFSQKVMCLDCTNLTHTENAHVYRVGVANAADRGLDMYSNWGPAIQIKHMVLDEELAESIIDSVSSDRIVIVCKAVHAKLIISVLNQIGYKSRIQSVITENDLAAWYEKALRGTYADNMAEVLQQTLTEQIALEFPSVSDGTDFLSERHYETIQDDFWN